MPDLSLRANDNLTFARFTTAAATMPEFDDIAPDLADLGGVHSVMRGSSAAQREPGRPGVSLVISGVAFLTHAPTGLCTAPVSAGQALGANGLSGVWMTDGRTLDVAFDTLIAHYGAETAFAIYARAEAQTRAAIEAELACALSHRAGARFARWILRLLEAEPVIILNQAELARLSGLQRTSVCAAMAGLQDSGGIKVMRGRITVRNVRAVEQLACACHTSASRNAVVEVDRDSSTVDGPRYHRHDAPAAN